MIKAMRIFRPYMPVFKRRRAKAKRAYKLNDMAVSIIGGILIAALVALAYKMVDFRSIKADIHDVRAMRIPYETADVLYDLSVSYKIPFYELLAVFCADNGFKKENMASVSEQDILERYILDYTAKKNSFGEKQLAPYIRLFSVIMNEMLYFPIAEYDNEGYMYGDSYRDGKLFDGGKYYATDIIDRENREGRLSIVSVTAGIIEEMGYNGEDGNYIKIRTPNMNLYCYSRLNETNTALAEGYAVYAGEVLGTMGSTGVKESNYPVRLTLSILVNSQLSAGEVWINPYIFLRFVENSVF